MSLYLEYNKPRYFKLSILLLILAALYLGVAIATEDYITSVAILVLPIVLLLSPFQLLLGLVLVFQINAMYLPSLALGPLDLRLNDLIIALIVAKLFLDLFINEGNIYWKNWNIPKEIKFPVLFFIGFCLLAQLIFLILGGPKFIPSTVTLARFLTNVVSVFIIPAVIKKEYQLKTLIVFILVLVVIQACIGNMQFVTGKDIFGTIKEGLLRHERVAGLFEEPASFGIYSLLGLCFFVGMYIQRIFPSLLSLSALFILLLAILFSQSRTTWLAFVAILPLIAWEFNVRGKGFLSIILFLILSVGVFLFHDLAKERVLKQAEQWQQGSDESNSYIGRWNSMKLGIATGVQNHFLGSGWDTYQYNAGTTRRLKGLEFSQVSFKAAHSAYIQIFSDIGILGLIAFLAVLYKSILFARRLFKETSNDLWRATAFGIFIWLFSLSFWLMTGQLVAGTTQSNFLWLDLGILASIYRFSSLNRLNRMYDEAKKVRV